LDVSNLWTDVWTCWNDIGEEMMKTPEEMAQQYVSTIADTHSVKAACEKAFIAGYEARRNQKQDREELWQLFTKAEQRAVLIVERMMLEALKEAWEKDK